MKRTSIALIMLLLTVLLASCGENPSLQTSTPTKPAITATPTEEPTMDEDTPTPEPTTSTAPGDAARAKLGGTIEDFKAKYGNPDGDSTDQMQYFNNKSITTFPVSTTNSRVYAILLSGNDGNGWSTLDVATTECRTFLPEDATFKRTVEGTDKIQRVYISPSIAPLFPTKDFTDENLDATDPGTIAIVYSRDTISGGDSIINCSIQVGLDAI